MLTTRIVIIIAVVLGLSVMPAYAQRLDDPTPITLGETLTTVLSGEDAAYFVYESPGNEVVSVYARGLGCGRENTCTLNADLDETLMRDTVLEVLNPQMKRLAYNDDQHSSQRSDLQPGDSAIERLVLPEPGAYRIRVNTYGGIFDSVVEITLEADSRIRASVAETGDQITVSVFYPVQGRYTYAFEAEAGEILSISARDRSGGLDPRLMLFDAAGELMAENDDHGTDDLTLDVLDAKISGFMIPAAGTYTLVLVEFMGRAGAFEILLESR